MLGRLTPFSSEYSGKTRCLHSRELALGRRSGPRISRDYAKGIRTVIFELSQSTLPDGPQWDPDTMEADAKINGRRYWNRAIIDEAITRISGMMIRSLRFVSLRERWQGWIGDAVHPLDGIPTICGVKRP